MIAKDYKDQGDIDIPSAYNAPVDIERSTVPPDGRPLAHQPRWRQDFPIDLPQDEYVSRRDLVKFMVVTSLAFATGQFWLLGLNELRREETEFPVLPVARLDEVPVGSHRLFSYPDENSPRLLVRTGENSFVAYDQQCTHLLCPVVPQVDQGLLHCPCHNGYFDLETGSPVAGPPRRPLARVTLEIRDGVIYATGMEASAS